MARSIVFHLQGSAGAQSSLVFGMKCRTARDNCQDAGERLVIIDQKVARGGAHEHLHAATAPKLLKGAQCFGILAGGAHIEGKIAVHAILGAAQLADRKSTRLNSSHLVISYAVFCLKKKNGEYSGNGGG